MTCNATAPDIGLRFSVDTQSGLMHAAPYPGQFDAPRARLESSTAAPSGGCCRVSRGPDGKWQKGASPNPAGRASVTKALVAAGFNPEQLRAEVIQKNVQLFRSLDPADKDEGATWRVCNEKCWILVNLPAKPVEMRDERGDLTDEEYQEELDLIAKERIAKMTPEEKFQLLSNTAPSDSVS